MESQMYIRVRGRVLGPYDQEKLQSLARRGQLSRMHELSTDGASWVRASNYPEFFTGNAIEAPSEYQVAADPVSAATAAVPAMAMGSTVGTPPNQSGHWYYTSGGAQRGPVEFANLQLLCASGQVQPDDLVWADGMPAWMPATRIPGLIQTSGAVRDGSGPVGTSSEVQDRVYRSAYSSKPWVVFIAIALCVYAALSALGGMWWLITGARIRSTFLVASGMFELVWALDAAVGAYLLNAYGSRLNSLQYSPKPAVLEKSLEALRAFWIYVAINLIVLLVFIGVVVVWAFAVGVTFPAGF